MSVNPILTGLLGNETVRAILIWQIAGQLAGGLLESVVTEMAQGSWAVNPGRELSPADLADAVVRGHLPADDAKKSATFNGISNDRFQTLVDNTGEPLPLQALLEAWRRGVIPEGGTGADSVSLDQGIRESRLKDKWIDPVKRLQWALLTPADVVNAWVRSQIPETEARERLKQAGVNTPEQTVLYNTTGRPPSPQELAELAHRGVIPWKGLGPDVLSVEQGIHEGDTKNKWTDVYQALTEYLPPPRTVTAMIREGALTDAQGKALFTKAGLPPELVTAYLAAAHHEKTAAGKELTKADILAAYGDGLIPRDKAQAGLEKLGWSAVDATLELDMINFRVAKKLLDSAVTRIKGLYIARKIDVTTARDALGKLGMSPAGISQAFAVWNAERAVTVLRLTPAQWATAVKNGWITADQALSQLQGMGYSAFEAWVYLSDQLKAPATASAPPPDVPARYVGGP